MGALRASTYSRMSAPTFQVTLQDLSFHRLIVTATPNTHVASLIEQFREVAHPDTRNQRIFLMREDGPLRRGTLGDNGIREDVKLIVVYGKNTACIHPKPITPYLYEWIEEGHILFYDPTRMEEEDVLIPMANIPLPHRPKTYHADCTELLAEHNEWITGQEYRFFLTQAPPNSIWPFPWCPSENQVEQNRIIHYQPSVGPNFPLNITLYPEGLPSDSHGLMGLDPFSSVKGTLHSIKLYATVKPLPASSHGDYECKYHFNVFLKGPIEIYDDRSTIIASFEEEALCVIKYDQMVRCDEFGGPLLPKAIANAMANAENAEANAENAEANAENAVANAVENRNQGGRSKQSKRSKRSKNKRKTRRIKRRV